MLAYYGGQLWDRPVESQDILCMDCGTVSNPVANLICWSRSVLSDKVRMLVV
jgi:hypothetical protein